MIKQLFLLIVSVLVVFIVSAGCVHRDDGTDSDSTLPWSRPANWEGKTLGIPL